jgi:hypothetical protein
VTYIDKQTGDEWPDEGSYIKYCLMVDEIRARNKKANSKLKEYGKKIREMYNKV